MSCPVCGSVNNSVDGIYRAYHQIFKGAYRLSCKSCGLVYMNPTPNEFDLLSFNGDYFFEAHGEECSHPTALNFSSGLAKIRLNHLKKAIQSYDFPISQVLEFGPGTGFFAKYFLEQNKFARYHAVETDKSCHIGLKSLGVEVVDVNNLQKLEGSIDLVVMSHVLEHVSDPITFMNGAYQLLRPGGIIFIEVPCMDFLHKDFDEPHLLFFDKKSLQTLLENLNFQDIKTSYHGVPLADLRMKNGFIKFLRSIYMKLKGRFIYLYEGDNEGLTTSEFLATFKFCPSKIQIEQAWWLRAIATKG